MSRRIVTYILFCTVAVYGIGLPQLVHHLVDHNGWGLGESAVATSCCGHTCDLSHSTSTDGCDSEESHDCMVCEMLATSHASVAPSVLPLLLHGPAPLQSASAFSAVHVKRPLGPHAPRGPPAVA